jgi:hypothetical protein
LNRSICLCWRGQSMWGIHNFRNNMCSADRLHLGRSGHNRCGMCVNFSNLNIRLLSDNDILMW